MLSTSEVRTCTHLVPGTPKMCVHLSCAVPPHLMLLTQSAEHCYAENKAPTLPLLLQWWYGLRGPSNSRNLTDYYCDGLHTVQEVFRALYNF